MSLLSVAIMALLATSAYVQGQDGSQVSKEGGQVVHGDCATLQRDTATWTVAGRALCYLNEDIIAFNEEQKKYAEKYELYSKACTVGGDSLFLGECDKATGALTLSEETASKALLKVKESNNKYAEALQKAQLNDTEATANYNNKLQENLNKFKQ